MEVSFAHMPDDAWFMLFNVLPPEDRARLACVDRGRAAMCRTPHAWKRVTLTPGRVYSHKTLITILGACAVGCTHFSARGSTINPSHVVHAVEVVVRNAKRSAGFARVPDNHKPFECLECIDLSHQVEDQMQWYHGQAPVPDYGAHQVLVHPSLCGLKAFHVNVTNYTLESSCFTAESRSAPAFKPTHASFHLTTEELLHQVAEFVETHTSLESLTLSYPGDDWRVDEEDAQDQDPGDVPAAMERLRAALEGSKNLRALKFHHDCEVYETAETSYFEVVAALVPQRSSVAYLELASGTPGENVSREVCNLCDLAKVFASTGDVGEKRAFTTENYPNLKAFVCQGQPYAHALEHADGWDFGDLRLLWRSKLSKSWKKDHGFTCLHKGERHKEKVHDGGLVDCVAAGVSPRFYNTAADEYESEDVESDDDDLDDSEFEDAAADLEDGSDDSSYSAVSSDDDAADSMDEDVEAHSDLEDEEFYMAQQEHMIDDCSDSEPAEDVSEVDSE